MSDTNISPASGSVIVAGVAAALAMSMVIAPAVGRVSYATNGTVAFQGTATVITPTVGATTLAGVAPTFSKPTVTGMVPTVASLALAGVASSVTQQNQNPNPVPGVLPLLYNAAVTGSRFQWPGGKGLFAVAGTFSGATVTLNILGPDGSTMLAAAAGLTAAGSTLIELPPCVVQAGVASGTPSGLYATFSRVPTVVG